mgnify:FL=1
MNSKEIFAIEAATDGACSGNPGNGGWGGLILFEDGNKLELGGSEVNTTNNRMELTAAIRTLEKLRDFKLKKNFKLRTDSKYVIEGYTNWIRNWKKNGWKSSSGKSVLNKDLWVKIDALRISGLSMEFVKGHSGDPSNERADLIATNFSKGIAMKLTSPNSSKTAIKETDPSSIQNLFTRIDLVNKFQEREYLLESNELEELLDLKDHHEISTYTKFDWRNWEFLPVEKKYWKIVLKLKDNNHL